MNTMTTSIMTSKGQILIPKAYRDVLGIKPRQPVNLKLKEKQIILEPTIAIDEMFGFLNAPPVSRKEQKEVIHQAVLEKFEAKEKRSGRS